MNRQIEIDGIQVNLVFKKTKNVNLRIPSPDGTVRVSAPTRTPLKHIYALVLSQLDWIKRHQTRIADCYHQPPLRYLHKELHQVWGKSYILYIVEDDRPPFVELPHTPPDPAWAPWNRQGRAARDRRDVAQGSGR